MLQESNKGARMRIPYGLSLHGKEEIAAVVKVLRGNTANAEYTKNFERAIAGLFRKKHGVMVNSGSSANLLAFELLNLPERSEVITPALTFATTVAPIIQKRLTPVFADVRPGSYVVDANQVESLVTKRTRALMIPSLIGNIPDYAALRDIARRHRLTLIEDSCDTLGAKFRGKSTGFYSDISTTSFYGSHIINGAGGGGLIAVHDRAWYLRLLVLRGWGRSSSLMGEAGASERLSSRFNVRVDGISYDRKFLFTEMGYNFLPLEISAAFGLEQLKKFPRFRATRKQNFRRLLRFFKSYEEFFVLPEELPGVDTVWLAFPLTIRAGAPFTRQEFATFLEKRGIQTRPIFTGNILRQPAFKNIVKGGSKKFPGADAVMRGSILLGCHQGLREAEMRYLMRMCETFLK